MRSAEEFNAVRLLIAAGMNDCAIARETGIPRKTIWEWRRRRQLRPRPVDGAACGVTHEFSSIPARAYCYVLSMYLGDGCISRSGRVWHLRITLDAKYPTIIEHRRQAIDLLMSGQRAAKLRRSDNCFEVSHYSKHWPCLLPQHGPGKKHTRRIALEPWQLALVNEATEDFIRGFIHSDGSRVVADDRGVKSVRYHFSNRSEDILGLFSAALDRLEIPWTRPSKRDIAIYRKAATARLDEFVGPKC